jgi:hypothetical protein
MSTVAVARPITTWPKGLLLKGFRFAVLGLIVIALVDPSNQITHSKEIFFAAAFLLWALIKLVEPPEIKLNAAMVAFAVAVALPAFGLLVGQIRGHILSPDDPLAFAKSFLFFLLLVPILEQRFPLVRVVVAASWLVVFATIGVFIVAIVNPTLFTAIYAFTIDKEVAIIASEREFGAGQYFFKAAPVMVFGFAYYLCRTLWHGKRLRDWAAALLFFVALFLSGSRANIAVAGLLLVAIPAKKIYASNKAVAWLLAVAVLLGMSAVVARSFLDPGEHSNKVKIAHYDSYLELFDREPSVLVVGQGMGASFYTRGFLDKAPNTVLSYMDMIRMFGIPVTALFAWFLLFPTYGLVWADRQLHMRWALGLAYVGYLLIAGTNPLLLSSTGMLVLVMIYALRWQEG